jgi:hypothetical protein
MVGIVFQEVWQISQSFIVKIEVQERKNKISAVCRGFITSHWTQYNENFEKTKYLFKTKYNVDNIARQFDIIQSFDIKGNPVFYKSESTRFICFKFNDAEQYYLVDIDFINEKKTIMKCVLVSAHGSSCPYKLPVPNTENLSSQRIEAEFGANIQDVPSNMIVLMNCNTTVVSQSLDSYYPLSTKIFEEIQVKYTSLQKKLCMIDTIKQFYKTYNYKFCVYTKHYPNLGLSFMDNNEGLMGIFNLPLYSDIYWTSLNRKGVKDKMLTEWITMETRSPQKTEMCSPRHIPGGMDQEQKLEIEKINTLHDVISDTTTFFPKTIKGQDVFYVVIVNSCRHYSYGIKVDYGIEMNDPRDPMLHTVMFSKLYSKIASMHGGKPYPMFLNVLGKRRKFTLHDGNLYTKYQGKNISLLEALSEDKKIKEKKAIVII